MKPATTGAVSGCIVWVLVFFVLGMCLLPIAFVLGGMTSISPFAIGKLTPIICPEGTTGTVYSYPTTSHDSNGNPIDSTAHELHCVDGSGQTVKKDPVVYAFLWLGIVAGGAVIVMAIMAFILAAPAGVLIGRLRARRAQSRS